MKISLQLFFIVLVFTLFSCSPGDKYKKEMLMLDSINAVLAAADSMLGSVDTSSVERISAEISADLKTISERSSDTLSKDHALLLDHYNGVEVALEKSSSMIFVLKNDLEFSKQQAAKLMNDLNKNIADDSKVNGMIEAEQQSAEKIYENARVISSSVKENILQFDSLNRAVNKFIGELR